MTALARTGTSRRRSSSGSQPIEVGLYGSLSLVVPEMVWGFIREGRTRGWIIHHDTGMPKVDRGTFNEIRPAATVLLSLCPDNPAELRQIQQHCDIVISLGLDATASGLHSVNPDDRAIGRLAAEHLGENRLRHFAAFEIGALDFAAQRIAGFSAEVAHRGLNYHGCCRFVPGDGNPLAPSAQHMAAWLLSLPRPLGLFTICDGWAHVAQNGARLAGLRIPEDVAMISCDNIPLFCEMARPPLSSIIVPWQVIGAKGAAIVADLLDNPGKRLNPVCHVVGPIGVARRQSSDLLAVDDPEIAAILQYIHTHLSQPLRVSDVFRAVPADRRRIERKFRQIVGRPLVSEIRRVRLDHASRLLISTNFRIEEIATRCGFSNLTRFGEAFRHQHGLSPSQYRLQTRN